MSYILTIVHSMEKLIFNKLYSNITKFFLSSIFIVGLIVWTIQAVNYFDFVTEDGHGLKVYFIFTLLNFPKIIDRLLPFIYFISLFYTLLSYEAKNELNVFWINGINKIKFINRILNLTIIFTIIQFFLSSYLSPYSQSKARSYLKESNVDFFTSLVKSGKFINIVKNMTIFIEKKNNDGSFQDIFIEDNRKSPRMIYAKKGQIIGDNNKKKFELIEGRIINNNLDNTNIFNFNRIILNLSDINSKTITSPKIQELKSILLLKCLYKKNFQLSFFNCNKKILPEIKSELYKRFIKPFYIPTLALVAMSLIITSIQKKKYYLVRNILFLFGFFIIIFSEASTRYVVSSNSFIYFLIFFPIVIFSVIYFLLYKRLKYV